MKLKFDSNLEYQQEAVNAVVDLFDGQPVGDGELGFEIEKKDGGLDFPDLGVGNRLEISDETLYENIIKVQEKNKITDKAEIIKDVTIMPKPLKLAINKTPTKSGESKSIETSYLKNGKNFSVEMETGTGKTYVYLRTIYELHQKYGFKKFIIVVPSIAIREGVLKNLEITQEHFKELYGNIPLDYFVYDSIRLGKLRSFATSNTLQIMIINIDSFRRDENIIKRPSDRMSGRKPIEFLQSTNPLVIMDEPQNMETEKSKKAIEDLNPLCTLRYSATHRDYYNLIYRLTPVDAYDLGLVKKIEVDSVREEQSFNDVYIEVVSIIPQKTQIKAKLIIEKAKKDGIKKESVTINTNGMHDLYELSGERDVYEGYVVSGINAEEGYVEFTNDERIYMGKPKGIMLDEIQKAQIEETIKEHLEKELKLKDKGIKVLSLFFIDKVKSYRDYEVEDQKGKFAKWFEEIYDVLIKKEKYKDLNSPRAEKVHEGYFSKDSKGRLRDSSSGDAQYDEPTYDLIMKDKEKLLSIDEPIKFIFSHSALREGWDNPNVFQICTLNETNSNLKKRQEIGRGLRIPVNQDGERVFNDNLNILTVIANESYEDFARALQTEIEEDAGVEFGKHRIKNQKDRTKLKLKKGWNVDEEFILLWKRIEPKTRYSVQLSSDELVSRIVKKLEKMPVISPPKIRKEKVAIDIDKEKGVETKLKVSEAKETYNVGLAIPDLIGYLSQGTDLTKSTLFEILIKSKRLKDALINPQQFLDSTMEIINSELKKMMVDGIKYEKLGEEYAMSLFESEELESYINNLFEVKTQEKTLFDYILYDSEVEKDFAMELESLDKVKFYLKLPHWFKIDTPLGTYNPDWAVVLDGDKRIYFVAETKGSMHDDDLRPIELLKIKCGIKHFEELDGVEFDRVVRARDLIRNLQ